MRVYLAGPMTGLPDYGREAFDAAAAALRAAGHEPVSPHDTKPDHDGPCPPGPVQTTAYGSHPYGCWLRASLAVMLTCDAVLMLPGWLDSNGATVEWKVARACAIPVHSYADDVKNPPHNPRKDPR